MLTPSQREKIIELILPYVATREERRALVESALHGLPVLEQINWSGNAQTFAHQLVRVLTRYGTAPDGEKAPVKLLRALKAQTGTDKQQQIEKLIYELQTETPKITVDDSSRNSSSIDVPELDADAPVSPSSPANSDRPINEEKPPTTDCKMLLPNSLLLALVVFLLLLFLFDVIGPDVNEAMAAALIALMTGVGWIVGRELLRNMLRRYLCQKYAFLFLVVLNIGFGLMTGVSMIDPPPEPTLTSSITATRAVLASTDPSLPTQQVIDPAATSTPVDSTTTALATTAIATSVTPTEASSRISGEAEFSLQNLNQWLGQNDHDLLESNATLDGIASSHLSYVMSGIRLADLTAEPTRAYLDRQSQTIDRIATINGFEGDVELAVYISDNPATLEDINTLLNEIGNEDIYQRYTQIGVASDELISTQKHYTVVILGE